MSDILFSIIGSCKVILYNWIFIQLTVFQHINYVLAYVLFWGVKKFCELFLVHPYIPIYSIKRNDCQAIIWVVYNYVALLLHDLFFGESLI